MKGKDSTLKLQSIAEIKESQVNEDIYHIRAHRTYTKTDHAQSKNTPQLIYMDSTYANLLSGPQ